ncbi:MAG: TonB-dependent receptor [Cytophagales bacterium]|nr:TonB-dependent receptor [Cytophagales bacterium]
MIKFFLIFFPTSLLLAQVPPFVKDTIKTQMLDEVISTATRSHRLLSSLPLSAQIVGRDEIEQGRNLRLGDLLSEQTNLITVADLGGVRSVQMQGMDSEHILVMIDGVPLIGRTAGSLDINRIALFNVEQVEIVKGASSSLYGNEALGGIIHVITRKPKEGMGAEAQYRGGSFGTHNLNTQVQYKESQWSGTLGIDAYRHGGYDVGLANDALNTVEPFENYTISSRTHYKVSAGTEITMSGRYYHQRQDHVAADTLRGESSVNEWNINTKGKFTHTQKWKTTMEFYATQYDANEFLRNPAGSLWDQRGFKQGLLRPEIRSRYNIRSDHLLIAGLGSTHEFAIREEFSQNPIFYAPYGYLQYDGFFLNKKLNLLSGFRFDGHNVYAFQLSPKLALRYQWTNYLSTKVSVGYGYRAPAFRQLYFNFTNSTIGYTVLGYEATQTHLPELEENGTLSQYLLREDPLSQPLIPENSLSYNLGLEIFPIPSLSTRLAVFRNNISNLIDTRIVARKKNGQGIFSYYNVNAIYTQGIESDLKWEINKNLNLAGGYQYLLAKDKTALEQFENGEIYGRSSPKASTLQLNVSEYFGLYNRSKHMLNGKVFYNIPTWGVDANIRLTYRSRYGLQDTNQNSYLDELDEFIEGYMIWDVAIAKVFARRYQLALGADNALGFTHPQVSEVPGRIAYVKLSVQSF